MTQTAETTGTGLTQSVVHFTELWSDLSLHRSSQMQSASLAHLFQCHLLPSVPTAQYTISSGIFSWFELANTQQALWGAPEDMSCCFDLPPFDTPVFRAHLKSTTCKHAAEVVL